MKYIIKELRPEYEAYLWDLLYNAIFVAREEMPPAREMKELHELKKYMQHWGEKEGDYGLIALSEENQPLGAVWIRLFNEDDKCWGYVDQKTPELNIALSPTFRNQGIGTELMVKMLKDLKANYDQVSLSVNPNNPSVRLYERFGFEKYEEVPPAITMIKKLK